MNTNLAGCFETYNQLPYLPQWDYPCDKLAGSTNGKKVGNNLTPNETVYIYRKGICRALPFVRLFKYSVSIWYKKYNYMRTLIVILVQFLRRL